MGWAAWDIEVDGHGRIGTIVDLLMIDVWSARNCACSDSDDNFWFRNGVVSFFQSLEHILGNGAGDQNTISVSW